MKMGLDQRGFTMLEVLVTVVLLGILATFAVPRFANATMLANTAKVQNDLQTLDAAIAIYEMEKGTEPSKLSDLAEYVRDLDSLHPPKGACKLRGGEEVVVDDDAYSISAAVTTGSTMNTRAFCEGHVASDFGTFGKKE